MPDLEKVAQALEICASREPGEYTCNKCPYETRVDGDGCEVNLMLDALAMLKKQQVEIEVQKIMGLQIPEITTLTDEPIWKANE